MLPEVYRVRVKWTDRNDRKICFSDRLDDGNNITAKSLPPHILIDFKNIYEKCPLICLETDKEINGVIITSDNPGIIVISVIQEFAIINANLKVTVRCIFITHHRKLVLATEKDDDVL
jgi:hypothetical protein